MKYNVCFPSKKIIISTKTLIKSVATGVLLVMGVFCMLYKPVLSDQFLAQEYTSAASQFISIDEHNIHFRDEGQGPVLILLHAPLGSLENWTPWAKTLTSHFRVLRFDLPNHGLSKSSSSSHAPSAEDILYKFTEKLSVEKFYLLAHYTQAQTALNFHKAHPQRIKKFAFVSAQNASLSPLPFACTDWTDLVSLRILAHFTPRSLAKQTLQSLHTSETHIHPQVVTYTAHLLQSEKGLSRVLTSPLMTKEAFIDQYASIQSLHFNPLLAFNQDTRMRTWLNNHVCSLDVVFFDNYSQDMLKKIIRFFTNT